VNTVSSQGLYFNGYNYDTYLGSLYIVQYIFGVHFFAFLAKLETFYSPLYIEVDFTKFGIVIMTERLNGNDE